MKKFYVFFGLGMFILTSWSLFPTQNEEGVNAELTGFSTWIWDTEEIIEYEALIKTLGETNINRVYLQVNRDLPKESYQRFIKLAKIKDIEVYALDGSPKWLKKEDQRNTAFQKWMQAYQKRSSTDEQFGGIHLDVEPYATKDWDEDRQGMIRGYQEIIKEYKRLSTQLNMPLAADIPFWFDGQTFSNEEFGTGILSEWVIDQVDSVTIMAYRNFSEGNNGIIKLIEDEIRYAERKEKKVEVGVETQKLATEYLTFYGGDIEAMEKTLNDVYARYHTSSSFTGFAIHKFESWEELLNHEN